MSLNSTINNIDIDGSLKNFKQQDEKIHKLDNMLNQSLNSRISSNPHQS